MRSLNTDFRHPNSSILMTYIYVVTGFSEECATFRAEDAHGSTLLAFSDGKPVKVPKGPIRLIASSPGRACDCLGLHAGGPCISHRAWECLRPIIEPHVQAIPVAAPDGDVYYALNVINVIDCLIRESSELSIRPMFEPSDPLYVSAIYKHEFNLSIVKDASIFTIPEMTGREVYVSQEIKNIIAKHQLTGFLFRQVYPPRKLQASE